MRKIFSLFLMTFVSVMMFAATETTVYYTAPAATIGTYSVKLNVNFKGDGDDWHQFDMTKTALTYNGDPVYSYKYTDAYDGVGVMQFQLYDGETWKSQKVAISSWTGVATYNGKMYVHATEQWVAAPADGGESGSEGAYELTFVYYNKTDGDSSGKLSTVEGVFDEESQAYVAEVTKGSDVYAGRKYKDDITGDSIFSNLKFGSSSKAGQLTFTLKEEVEVDSIVFHAAMYSDSEGGDGFSVNGTAFTLSRGKLKFEEKVWKPTGKVSSIDIVQAKANKGRFFLTAISVYPKQSTGGDDPVVEPEVKLPVVAIAGTMNEWSAEANVMVAAEDSLSASVKMTLKAQKYEFKVVSDDKWLSLNGEGETLYGIHREWNEVAHINGVDLRNFELTADVAGEYTFTWTYADSTLLVTFPEKSEEPIVEPEVKLPVVAIAGAMNEWSAEANVMVAAEDSLSASVKMTLKAQKYEFKVVSDDKWLSLNGEGETLYGIHREWNEVAHINGVDLRNFELTADVAGEYTFTWTYADSTLLVTFPDKPEEPVVDPSVLFEGTQAITWTTPLEFEAAKFAEAKAGDKIVVTYTSANDADLEFKEMKDWNHIAGSREAVKLNDEGTFEQFLTAKAVEDIKAHGLQIIGNNFTCTKVQLLEGKAPKEGTTVWTGFFWADTWSTLELYKEGYNYVDFSKVKAVRFYSEAASGEYKLNFLKGWEAGEKFADQDAMTDGEGYKELALTDDLRTAMSEAGHWMIQFNKEELGAFNVTDIVLVMAEPVVEHTYTVAGDSEAAFGTTWDPANTANDMTKQEDGTYKWEKEDVELLAGVLTFKVAEDHSWDVAYPAENYQLNIAETGKYNVTITFNPAAEDKVAATATKTGEAVIIPTIAMHGNFTGSWVDTKNFTVAEGNETASLTMELTAGNYEFGMRIGGSANWTANGVAFTLENTSAVVVAGSGNLTLAANIEGEYTFTWTFATNTLSIKFPEGEIVEPTLADGYYIIGLNGWEVADLTENDLFWSTGIETGEFSLEKTLKVEDAFKVVYVVNDAIKAWFPEGDNNNYVVDQNHAGTTTIYFRPGYNGNEDWHEGCIFVVPTTPTGIDGIDADAKAVKVLRNGQLLIIKGDKTYNVMGTLVR